MKPSRISIVALSLPCFLALALFYTLAVHMRRSLGGWPSGIGTSGFPPALLTHAAIATHYFWTWLLVSLLTLPVLILTSLLVPRWRALTPYFALYGFLLFTSIAFVLLSPEPYLDWWAD